ncbi:hypothetical protein TNCV_4869151 [Trichonephila clavipes]|nr:hypothetical protein TNCV_4869151 [Trichonephila clavipes]
MEFKIFVEKYAPDLILIQETHLRPKYNINIPNYICYRNDRDTGERARGGTLILIRRNFPHYNLPTPHSSTSRLIDRSNSPHLTSIPFLLLPYTFRLKSDERLFTLDLEQLLQTNGNCVIFGDLNATHNRVELLSQLHERKAIKNVHGYTQFNYCSIPVPPPASATGLRNTLDIAVINNFNFPFTMDSIPELFLRP